MASNAALNIENIPEDEMEVDEDATGTIERLPDECLLSILDNLTEDNLIALSLVSKRFRKLADRMFRMRFANTNVAIQTFPSLKLQRFGSSIKTVNFLTGCDASKETTNELCELCPNLKNVQFFGKTFTEIFFNSLFRKMLPQFDKLYFQEIVYEPETPELRSDLIAACKVACTWRV